MVISAFKTKFEICFAMPFMLYKHIIYKKLLILTVPVCNTGRNTAIKRHFNL